MSQTTEESWFDFFNIWLTLHLLTNSW